MLAYTERVRLSADLFLNARPCRRYIGMHEYVHREENLLLLLVVMLLVAAKQTLVFNFSRNSSRRLKERSRQEVGEP